MLCLAPVFDQLCVLTGSAPPKRKPRYLDGLSACSTTPDQGDTSRDPYLTLGPTTVSCDTGGDVKSTGKIVYSNQSNLPDLCTDTHALCVRLVAHATDAVLLLTLDVDVTLAQMWRYTGCASSGAHARQPRANEDTTADRLGFRGRPGSELRTTNATDPVRISHHERRGPRLHRSLLATSARRLPSQLNDSARQPATRQGPTPQEAVAAFASQSGSVVRDASHHTRMAAGHVGTCNGWARLPA